MDTPASRIRPTYKGNELFWTLIDKAYLAHPLEVDSRVDYLIEQLAKHPAKDILTFELSMRNALAQGYTWPLWGAGYVMGGGMSDDGFEYFRLWLMMQGHERYTQAIANPDNMADWLTVSKDMANAGELELEPLMYVAREALELGGHNPDLVDSVEVPYPDAPLGSEWNEEEVYELYPKLAEIYSPEVSGDM